MQRKPDWLKMKLPKGEVYNRIKGLKRESRLHTVCEEALCPNIGECWAGGTATYMVLGDTCTRGCRFCHIKTAAKPLPPNPLEPLNLARAIEEMKLSYVVVTSVDRDDLEDQGSMHFAHCIAACKEKVPTLKIEVLIPDFQGREDLLKHVIDAGPDVIAHNVETVERLQRKVRDRRANYEQSLAVLKNVKKVNPSIFTKSSIMVGVGETKDDVLQTMKDLRDVGCDFLTVGQYLQPTKRHMKVEEYVHPDVFKEYKQIGDELGFLYVASGPFVRSSYKAGELFIESLIEKRNSSKITKAGPGTVVG